MPLDIGVGILLSLIVSHIFGVEPTAVFVVCGVLFALLPDIDILPPLARVSYDHRSFLHYPAVYVPFMVAIYFWAGPLWGTLFTLAIVLHFIHDTIGLGWGVAWLWPLTPRKFLFPGEERKADFGFFMTWLPEQEPALGAKYHKPNWLQEYYLRPNAVAYIEYGMLLVGILFLIAHVWGRL